MPVERMVVMKQLYAEKTANYPRLKTDTFFADYNNRYNYVGYADKALRYIEAFQLTTPELWRRFVEQFRHDADYEAGWRGEYWGKMMRGACFTYSYTQNKALYDCLTQTVIDMIESADENGRISSYAVNHEFDGWDVWCRKYVLLGMQYFMEICTDEALKARIVDSMSKQVDYLIGKLGRKEDGKREIATATRHWRGLNACSILEPIVRLYNLTGEQRYFDFAKYIADCGGTDIVNIFELAYKNEFYPYQYPVTKAYEMTSCFEGLLEFYRVTGEEWMKTALINFANRILESDYTVIGSCGCTHELFDHSTVRQANTTNGKTMQETCVTVTLMKFFYQLALITGDVKFSDAFEISYFNAYLGAINTDKVIEPVIQREHPDWNIEPLPFGSYSPLTAGTRGNGIGGLKVMSDNHYYGCCACIGSLGNGLLPKMQLLTTANGLVLNMFVNGTAQTTTPNGTKITFETATDYPKNGTVNVVLHMEKDEQFVLLVRNPVWSTNTALSVNGIAQNVTAGYIALDRVWKDGDTLALELDLTTKAIRPIPYGHDILMNHVVWGHNYMIASYDTEDPLACRHIALQRGPVMLAQENRLGYSVDDPIDVKVNDDGSVSVEMPETDTAPYAHLLELKVPLTDGSYMTVTDYASAGKLWTEESKMAVWMLTK